MSIATRTRLLVIAGFGAALSLASPAFAQMAAEPSGADVPTCSATVTDHCMNRGHAMGHGAMGHHHMAMKGHHHMARMHHHKMMKHHHMAMKHHAMAHHGAMKSDGMMKKPDAMKPDPASKM
ncbi:hypothetical protein [Novosphingobium lentum]|uniref:hypothetical protein n=1 Tax=Novosphingobium lentum TaxID=145287 RepID=UPI000AC76F5B|nr:hypothetical protein [Novosphingobium lentum]